MSVSLWNWSESCEGKPCPGDCDNCSYDPGDDNEEENDMGVYIWNDLIRWASWSRTFENRLLAIFCGTKIGE